MALADFYDPNTGVLTAGGDMAGFVCRRSGQKQTQSRLQGNTNPSSLLVDTSGCAYPIVALQQVDGHAAALRGVQGSANLYATSAPIGTTFNWWLFDFCAALPEHTAEFQLRHQVTNQIIFSNRFWPMKMIGGLAMGEGGNQPQYNAAVGVQLAHAENTVGGHSRVGEPQCWDGGVPQVDPDLPNCSNIRGQIDGKLYGAVCPGTYVRGVEVSYDDVMASFGDYTSYMTYGGGFEVANLVMVIDVTNIPLGVNFF